MNDLERAKKEFFAKNWEAGIAAAKKTNMEDPVLRYFFGYCREHGYGMERNDADAVRTAEEDEGERMETDASSAGGASRFALVLPLRVFRKPRNGHDDGACRCGNF